MNAAAIATAMLIGLLRTHNEGGAVQIEYPDMASCQAGAAELEAGFEAQPTPNGDHPSVITFCMDVPDQH